MHDEFRAEALDGDSSFVRAHNVHNVSTLRRPAPHTREDTALWFRHITVRLAATAEAGTDTFQRCRSRVEWRPAVLQAAAHHSDAA